MIGSFLIPGVAAAALAAAVALPIIVHWLFRQRERLVEWAAMRFLLAVPPRRRRRIDHWPLLLARMFALLLPLAAMLAVLPGLERVWQFVSPGPLQARRDSPRTHTVLIFDASLSMTARADGEQRLEAARAKALDLLNAANPGDGFSLIVLDRTADVRVPGPSGNLGTLRDELQSIKPFHGPSDAAAGLAAAAELLSRSPGSYAARRVVAITDCQRSAWGGLLPSGDKPPPDVWQRLTGRADVAIVDVGLDGLENLCVDDFALADPLPLVDEPLIVKATFGNHSNRERQQVAVELQIGRAPDFELVTLDRRVLDAIPAGGQSAISFLLEGRQMPREPGPYVLRAAIMQSDALAADDTRSIAFEVRDGLNVLLVNGRPSGTPLRRASEFFSEALAPGGRASPGSPFRTRTVSPEEFTDATLTDLAAVDCVVLCDVPGLTPSQIARLEAHLKRGRGVIVALGPNAAASLELYNRLLGPGGAGWLPGEITGIARPPEPAHLTGTDAAFRQSPLVLFQDANARAGLTSVPFEEYVRLRLPRESVARTVLAFAGNAERESSPDPALLDVPRHRGRVIVFASTLNREWTDWPVLPSYLPFAHELVRFASARHAPWTIAAGEAIEEHVPDAAVGQFAELNAGSERETAEVGAAEAGGVVRFPERSTVGVLRFNLPGFRANPIAVNVPGTAAGLGESNLARVEREALAALGVQVVDDLAELRTAAGEDAPLLQTPQPHGPDVARWLAWASLGLLAFELLLAWRLGPGRGTLAADAALPRLSTLDRIVRLLGWLLLAAVAVMLAALIPAGTTGKLPDWAAQRVEAPLERFLEVPQAEPGEGTQLRFTGNFGQFGSRYTIWVLLALLGIGATLLYARERRAVGSMRPLLLPLALRLAVYAAIGFIVLPQLQLVFERETTPEVVIVIDDSGSMGAGTEGAEQRLADVQELLSRNDGEWLARLMREKRVRLSVYRLAELALPAASCDAPVNLPAAVEAINTLIATGQASRLGDGLASMVKAHRGGSAAAIVLFSDGIVTAGAELPQAARSAGRAGIPVFTVGVGSARERIDVALTDLKMDDVVVRGDELIVEARVTARGAAGQPVTVTLSQRRGGETVVVDQVVLEAPASGQPVPIRLRHAPQAPGEAAYVLEAQPLPGELNRDNNRAERLVTVTEDRKLRVLLLDGRARYEFRFLKSLFDRETDQPGERSLDFRFYLADAGKDFATTDRAALRAFPSRGELFEYDVVILGDLDPQSLPRPDTNIADLADFVRVRGGGLLVQAGDQAIPWRYFESPLADLLPILPAGSPALTVEEEPLQDGYRLALTPLGRLHPLMRLAGDDRDAAALWANISPMLWAPGGYRARLAAEVLAVHPTLPAADASGERLPLIIQQFFGAGRVVFVGFDETWRWRLRQDEELFNRFWRQAVRVLARNRVSRAELRTARPGPFYRNDPITVLARFPDDAPPPEGTVRLALERVPAGGAAADREQASVALERVPGTRATYEAVIARTPEGDYRVRIAEPADARNAPALTFTVRPPPGEMDRLEPDLPALSRTAAESGGKYYDLDAAAGLIDDLPEGYRPPLNQQCPPWLVWNQPLIFALILALLGGEWILRKRVRLV